ncbi:uncharacterized protein N7496_008533 [Penicillium cataractarum]|uniref:Cyanovirin-N domain-containing protein n=1 Tax=Penicillium cataractarum TaxID=2100454 RepID=A0A9W9S382_9EURO|nr:uncharacterized protein N7496_008533 [Penicillium cataractarum]KAJ5368773.1 hypothetical protein N7496_008533 [Penicillium cataractarum]
MNGTKNLGIRSDGADTYLYGECRFNEDPWAYRRSEIRLDDFLGDEHGFFKWGGHDFTEKAVGVRFGIEGQQHVPVLHAYLRGDFGDDYAERDVNLAEHIYNYGGNLQYRP